MKKYMLIDDLYCLYITKSKKDLINFTKWYLQNWNRLKDLWLYSIKYNSKKIDIDNFFWDIIATDKKTDESIEYDDYWKYWIVDWIAKKDFLYHNL
jgi:hypothetical protein